MLFFVTALGRSGKETLGIYYFARAIGTMTVDLCEFGMSRYLICALAGEPSTYRNVFGAVVIARALAVVMGFLALLSITLCILDLNPRVLRSVLLLSGAYLLMTIADLFLDVLRAREEMRVPVLLRSSYTAVYVAVGIYGLMQGRDLEWVIVGIFISTVIYLVTCVSIIVCREGIPGFTPEIALLRQMVTEIRPFATRMLLGVLNGKIVLWYLYANEQPAALGEFGAAFYLVEALMMFAFAVSSAAFPKLAADYKVLKKLGREGPAAGVKILLLIIVPIAVGTSLLAHKIIPAFYGSGYGNTVLLLQIGIWAAVALFMNSIFVTILQAIGESKTAARLLGPTILVNVVLGAILVPRFGSLGAVWTVLISEWILVVLQLMALRLSLNISKLFEGLGGLLLSVSGMALVVFALKESNLWTSVLLGTVAFGVLSFFFYPFTSSDIRWLRSALTQPRAGLKIATD